MTAKEKVLVYECISGGGLLASGGPAVASDGGTATPDAALLAQGVAMRDALAADLQRLRHVAVTCVATPQAPLPARLQGVRSLCPHPQGGPTGGAGATSTTNATNATPPTVALPAADFLARQAPHYDRVWVIAPESDGLLVSLAATVGSTRWVGCSLPAIRLAASKAATRAHLASRGIPVPAAWHPGDAEPSPSGAWVVKPDDGAGSVDTRLHRDFAAARADLLGRRARGQASTLEAWVGGIPLSLSLLCAGGRAELLSINRQRIVARPGELVTYAGVDIDAAPVDSPAGRLLAVLAQRIAAAMPGLAGYVGVDLVWRPVTGSASDAYAPGPAGPVVIEINPRLTCAFVGLSKRLGRNLAGEILLAQHPESVTHVLH